MELSTNVNSVLKGLLSNVEQKSVDINGDVWMSVYLDNARPDGMSANVFAGCLSALEKRGIYKSLGDNCFGDVKVARTLYGKELTIKY